MTSHKNNNGTHCEINSGARAFLVALLLVLGLLAYQCWAAYQTACREAQVSASNLADVLTLEIESTLTRIHSDLGAFAQDVSTDVQASSQGELWRAEIRSRMARHLEGFKPVTAYRLFDAEGNAVVGAGEKPDAKFSVADRAWFRQLRDNPSLSFVVSEVLISKVSGAHALYFGVPVVSPSGRFVGALDASIDLGRFQATVDGLNIGGEGLVTLRHRGSGRLLLRRPKVDEQVNEAFTGLANLHGSDLMWAEGEFVSAVDGIRRLYAFRGVEGYPLTVVVAVSAADYLSSWYRQASMTAAAAIMLGGIMALLYRRLTAAYRRTVSQAAMLEALNINLLRSNEELEEFAYVASHDLQSPLRNIAGFSQLLQRRYKEQLGAEGGEFIDYIVSNAIRMSGLIQDLLSYARVPHQERPAGPVATDQVLNRTLADLAEPIADTRARICVSYLPELAINEHQLSSLFLNLIDNALKYRAPDRVPEISLSCQEISAGYWQFSIADNGIGIEPEYWDKVFRIFQRLHAVDRYEGSGIGLALCRRIVHRCGGEIWVESEPGKGSVFHFTLRQSD